MYGDLRALDFAGADIILPCGWTPGYSIPFFSPASILRHLGPPRVQAAAPRTHTPAQQSTVTRQPKRWAARAKT